MLIEKKIVSEIQFNSILFIIIKLIRKTFLAICIYFL